MKASDEVAARFVTGIGFVVLGGYLLFVIALLIQHIRPVSQTVSSVREPTRSQHRKQHHSTLKYAHPDKEKSHRDSDDSEND